MGFACHLSILLNESFFWYKNNCYLFYGFISLSSPLGNWEQKCNAIHGIEKRRYCEEKNEISCLGKIKLPAIRYN